MKTKCDYLIVALNTDELHRTYKDNRGPIIPFEQRKIILEGIKYVDMVISINTFSPMRELKERKVNVYFITKEWLKTKESELEYMSKDGRKVVFSPRFNEEKGFMCSTDIRKKIGDRFLASKGG